PRRRSRPSPAPLEAGLERHRLRRFLRARALVALERGARVAVVRGAEEEPQNLRHVVLVDAQVHHPLRVLVAHGLVLGAAQAELTGDALEVGQKSRPQGRITTDVIDHFVGRQGLVAALDVSHVPSGLPRGASAAGLEHLGIDLEEHDHAALAAEVPDVVRDVVRKLHDRAGGHDDLVAVDAHVRGALEDVDRLFLARVTVHDRRLARLVAGDLGPELIGLEQHLAHTLVRGERLEGVQIEHLGDARRRGHRGLVHRHPLLEDWWATVYLGSGDGTLDLARVWIDSASSTRPTRETWRSGPFEAIATPAARRVTSRRSWRRRTTRSVPRCRTACTR